MALLKDRIRGGHLLAACYHLLLRNIYYPLVLKRRYAKRDFPFLINLSPTCLRGSYYPDNDAVYLVDRDEVAKELCRAGGNEITRSVAAETRIPQTVCFVAVQKEGP